MQPETALIAQHIPRLRRYARALTGERARADDLVQDTLERALRKLHLWRAGSDLRAWLFTVMHNVHVNQVRGRAHGAEEATDPEDLPQPPPETGADQGDLMDLEAALARLADEQREVLLLVGLEQLTYQEAAAVLGIPIGTVMSRLSRARERLRALLDGTDAGAMTLKVVK
jgi:RNA polymerase sigma-70 factor (ECF subfamily)